MSETHSCDGMPHSRLGNVFRWLSRQAARIAACFALLIGQWGLTATLSAQVLEVRGDAKTPEVRQEAEPQEEDEAQIEQWRQLETHFSQQFRPLVLGHFNLVRQVCEPSKEQSVKIVKRSKFALQTGAKAMVEFQKKMQMGRFDPSKDKQPDPQKIIADELLRISREELPKEKLALLDEAIKRRDASRKRAALLCLVAKMDQDLYLSREQREKISERLDKNWNSSWQTNLQFYLHDQGSNYPQIPEATVAPELTARQLAVWKQLPKVDFSGWGWGGFLGHLVDAGEFDQLERDAEPKPADVEKRPDRQPPDGEKPADEKPAGEKPVGEKQAREARQVDDGAADVALDEEMLEAIEQQFDFNVVLFEAEDGFAVDEMEVSEKLQERLELLIMAVNRLIEPAVHWLFPKAKVDEPEVAVVVAEQAVDAQGAVFVVRASDEEAAEEAGEEEEGLTPQQRAIARANAAFEIGVENFDNWVFSNAGGRAKSVKRIDDQMRLIVDSLQQLFGLSEQQRQRLELCGKGDIARFEQRVEQTRARFMEVRKDQERFNNIWNDIGPLQQKMQAPFFDDQSLLIKSIISLLSGDQVEKYKDWQSERRRFHYQAKIELIVAEVEMYSPLTSEQRSKVVQLIADSGPPPKKRGQFDQVFVMYQMSVAPDAKWLAIIDRRQFDVFNKLRQQGRQYGQMLRQNGVVE